MKKKGQILVSNVVFIILNLIFISLLILFVVKQGQGAIVLEQSYAKQVALIIDSAKPGMIIKLNMQDAKKISDNRGVNFKDVVKIDENIVSIKLTPEGNYKYSFFNNVDVTPYPDDEEGIYVFVVNKGGNYEVD
jgi:hypothetical protein